MDFEITKQTAWYYTPNTYEIIKILQPAMVEAINGSKTVKEVVDSVRDAMQTILG